ncbi:MAG TPA: aminotransferase class III-fold pyridoxal phosphate-dependent enzyme, partial [Dyella sp.]|uniref:aminotransferase class III-fold pyridoxal phosphate-dependent enzyme n=1 Tax=Dyella sp. TaxID=1869338 RepID=UPI002CB52485
MSLEQIKHEVLARIKDIFAEAIGVPVAEVSTSVSLIEMGADSLILLSISRLIEESFGVRIPFRVFLEDLIDIGRIVAYLAAQPGLKPPASSRAPSEPTTVMRNPPSPTPAATMAQRSAPLPPTPRATAVASSATDSLTAIFQRQLEVIHRQMDILNKSGITAAQTSRPEYATAGEAALAANDVFVEREPADAPIPSDDAAAAANTNKQPITPAPFVPLKAPSRAIVTGLTKHQKEHIGELVDTICRQAPRSKAVIQQGRATMADSRGISGYSQQWKEMIFPLVAERAFGGRFVDIDGNEYIDLAMGYGALLFGHTPAFMLDALRQDLDSGLKMGLEREITRANARLLCELTQNERATFLNSGTEAVMTALRLARTATRRDKIAVFEGSYHGTFDGTLVSRMRSTGGAFHTRPAAPGVLSGMVDNVLLVKYDDPASLQLLKDSMSELAAVLVEPVQSRRPDLVPLDFLRELRDITAAGGTALIFDEVITGFRDGPGGFRARSGIWADMTIYGKALGAGLPVAAIAGTAQFLDAVDGGQWAYGDDSFPEAGLTICAGTYFKHPVMMSAVASVLEHVVRGGSRLTQQADRLAGYIASELNLFFEAWGLPLAVAQYASLFRFLYAPEHRFLDLLFFHLQARGVYIPETRNCFLSTAHTEEDARTIVQAVKDSVFALAAAKLLPEGRFASPLPKAADRRETLAYPLLDAQKQLWFLAQDDAGANAAYNQSIGLQIRGPLDTQALWKAVNRVIERHEALRSTIDANGDAQSASSQVMLPRAHADFSSLQEDERDSRLSARMLELARMPMDLATGPLAHAELIKMEASRHVLVLTVHHIVIDGYSMGVVIDELQACYAAFAEGRKPMLPEPMQFREFIGAQHAAAGDGPQSSRAYWARRLEAPPLLELPLDGRHGSGDRYAGDEVVLELPAQIWKDVQAAATTCGCTPFALLFGAFSLSLHEWTGQSDLIVGVPAAGQLAARNPVLVGYCLNMLPIRTRVAGTTVLRQYLKDLQGHLLEAHEHADYPFMRMVEDARPQRIAGRLPLIEVSFNLDRMAPARTFGAAAAEVSANFNGTSPFDLTVNVVERAGEGLQLRCAYSLLLLERSSVERFASRFKAMIECLVKDAGLSWNAVSTLSDEERRQVLTAWNATARPYERTSSIAALFAQQVQRHGDRIAVEFEADTLTYTEL